MRAQGCQVENPRRKPLRPLLAVASKRGLHHLSYKHVIASWPLGPSSKHSKRWRASSDASGVSLSTWPLAPWHRVVLTDPVVDIPATCCLSHTSTLACCHRTVSLTEDKPGGNTEPGPGSHGAPDRLTRQVYPEGPGPFFLIIHRVATVGQRCTERLRLAAIRVGRSETIATIHLARQDG